MCGHDPTYKTQAKVKLADGRNGYCDTCLAPMIQALNDGGFQTVASCCGHGHRPGSIIFADDRELLLMSYDEARKIDSLWPDIHGKTAERGGGS